MSDPGWVTGIFAVVMLGVSAFCVARLVLVRRLHRSLEYDVNFSHVADGVAMAGMLSPGLNVLPATAWEALFSGLALWFGCKSVRFLARRRSGGRSGDGVHGISDHLTHLVMACSMLYMYFAASPIRGVQAGAMAMTANPATADYLLLPLAFVVVLAVSAVAHIDAMSRYSARALVTVGASSQAATPERRWLAPRAEMGCHVAICIAMAFMLVLMF